MRRSGLNAAQQAFALSARFPEARGTLKASRLIWTAELQPTPLSRSYPIEVTFQPRQVPRVRVLEQLETRNGLSLPHVYSDGTLCLHRAGEWISTMFIVDTTVPWTSEWLANYEVWLATGDWHGGGEWPPPRATVADEGEEAKDPSGSRA